MLTTAFGLGDLFLFGIVWFSIWNLRKTHASEIYVTWLFFSFFFVLFLLLDAAVVKDVFGNSGAAIFEALRGYLMDLDAEVKMVLSIFALLVFPQLLTYFLSGISGSASPPVFVSQLANGAVWGLVKFLATLSGLIAAAATKDLVGPSSPFKLTLTIITAAIMGTMTPLAGAFLILLVHHAWRQGVNYMYQKNIFSPFRHVHEFFTRYSGARSEIISSNEGAKPTRI